MIWFSFLTIRVILNTSLTQALIPRMISFSFLLFVYRVHQKFETKGIFYSGRPVMTKEYQRLGGWERVIGGSNANQSTAEDQGDWGSIWGGSENQLGSARKIRNQRNIWHHNTRDDSRRPGTGLGVDRSCQWIVEIKIENRGSILTEEDQVDWELIRGGW